MSKIIRTAVRHGWRAALILPDEYFDTPIASLASGAGSTLGDGFGYSLAAVRTTDNQRTSGDSFDLSRLQWSATARVYSAGDGLHRVIATAKAGAHDFTTGFGFERSISAAQLLPRNITDGAGFGSSLAYGGALSRGASVGVGSDLSRVSAAASAAGFTPGSGVGLFVSGSAAAALSRSLADGFGLARTSVGSVASPTATIADGFGWVVAYYDVALIVGEFIGTTLGDAFGRSSLSIGTARSVSATVADAQTSLAVVSRLTAVAVPTYAGSSTSVRAVLSISWSGESVGSGAGSSLAYAGPADLHLGMFLEPTCNSAYAVAHDSYVLSFASVYSSNETIGRRMPVPMEYRRATFGIVQRSFTAIDLRTERQFTATNFNEQKSFEAIDLWKNRQFTTSGSTNTRTLRLTL